MMKTAYRVSVGLVSVLASACGSDKGLAPVRRAPALSAVTVTANEWNALSVIAQFQVSNADSARLLYRSATEAEQATPFSPTSGAMIRLAALGLRASTRYRITVESMGAGGTTRSDDMDVETGALPEAIRGLRLAVTGAASPGYTLVVPVYLDRSPGAFMIAFDEAGDIRWYRSFPGEGWAVEAKQHPNGHFTTYVGRSYGWQPNAGRYVEVTPSGEEVRTFRAAAPAWTDPHEMLLSFQDTVLTAAHLLSYEIRPLDLRAVGGAADTPVALHSIVRQGATGATEFVWNAADYFDVSDWPGTAGPSYDLVHPSSLALDRDGNYIASFQAVDQIAKIDAQSGNILWRFGGKRNEFTLLDDPLGGFRGQHSVRVLANGNLLLMDNHIRSPATTSRAVEYSLDAATRTARLVWEYRPDPAIASPIMGSVQRLKNGNTLVAFGVAGQAVEVDPAGRVVWRAALTDNASPMPALGAPELYRAIRIGSLYRYLMP
ncbi:MAG TPA: aryl-sulfate sulfotransferase [Gemmatimonadaceae bacterium]|nr:aryl-sulfate sulfotransferase [Gemmatimonadaceae bacterium]